MDYNDYHNFDICEIRSRNPPETLKFSFYEIGLLLKYHILPDSPFKYSSLNFPKTACSTDEEPNACFCYIIERVIMN